VAAPTDLKNWMDWGGGGVVFCFIWQKKRRTDMTGEKKKLSTQKNPKVVIKGPAMITEQKLWKK